MSTEYAGRQERLHTAEVFRDKWVWLVLLGSCIALLASVLLVMKLSLQSFVHVGDVGRHFASVRRLGLCRHRAHVAESRNDQLTVKSRASVRLQQCKYGHKRRPDGTR